MKFKLALPALGVATAMTSPALAQTCAPLRVMTYNIRTAVPSDGENRWELRRDQLIGQIELLRPDLLGLQEVRPSQRADLAKAMPSYEMLGVGRDEGQDEGESANLAVLRDRFDVRTTGTFWLSDTPDRSSRGWDAAFPRIATWARLTRREDGLRLLVLNTHLDHVGALARLQGARQISAFLAAHRKPGETLIVTGDFNATPDSPPLAALLEGAAALRDSRADSLAPPLGPAGTFNRFDATPETSNRIDYILHDPAWRTLRNTTLAMHGEDGRVASDHFPVIADLIDAKCVK